jgi:hypothetical protein
MHNTLHGMDSLLVKLTGEEGTLSEMDAQLVRRAAHRYSEALAEVKRELETPAPDENLIVAFAREALDELPATEPIDEGEHMSVRMCQWIARDRFIDLARILDADVAGDDVLAIARKRVARAYAGMSLR